MYQIDRSKIIKWLHFNQNVAPTQRIYGYFPIFCRVTRYNWQKIEHSKNGTRAKVQILVMFRRFNLNISYSHELFIFMEKINSSERKIEWKKGENNENKMNIVLEETIEENQ